MIKPKQLKPGDNIAVLSLSTGLPSVFPKVYQQGVKNLKALGFNVIEYPTATMDIDEVFNNPQIRAQDLNRAFGDKNVDGIIATIGGSDSARILKYLDADLIKANPKFIMGYSDFTAVSALIHQLGIVTFNGPSVMAGFAQIHNMSDEYQTYVRSFLFGEWNESELPVFSHFSDGYPDWSKPNSVGQLEPLQINSGPRFYQGDSAKKCKACGPLFGGCIEVLEMLKGTQYWPNQEFWRGKVLFLETSQEKPSIDYVRYWLRNYGVMGVFEQLSGLIFGRARDYSEGEKQLLDEVILSVVKGEFGCDKLPIVTNLDFGHTDPQMILPLGINIEIDVQKQKVKALESPFKL
ncbi:S66 family peptidase [Pseudoalteromonas luteoviolacea]|uniref:S66 family peptidase n=1 Tax=Pseudoalteromonas luteoviolacea TaxID=43657 RepID=UPI001B35A348|nr:S66 peptidase family protein [Pseudoalteromonas luteoviolacea]MBQ4836943.1 LD-carboxypeptidase [Pseudoalteromonas luteoviolacea]